MILFALTLALCVIYEVFFHFNNYKASFWAILNDVKTRKCILPAASLGLDIAREQRIYYKRLKNMARRLERRKWAISLLRFNISPLCVVRHSLRKIPYKRVCLYYWLFLSRFSCHHLKPAIIHIAIPLWNGAKWLNSRDLLLVFFLIPRSALEGLSFSSPWPPALLPKGVWARGSPRVQAPPAERANGFGKLDKEWTVDRDKLAIHLT